LIFNQAFLKAKDLDKGGADDEVRPWLRGFVKEVGLATARHLLDGAGILE